jgi:hypothetical protein
MSIANYKIELAIQGCDDSAVQKARDELTTLAVAWLYARMSFAPLTPAATVLNSSSFNY